MRKHLFDMRREKLDFVHIEVSKFHCFKSQLEPSLHKRLQYISDISKLKLK